MSAPERIWAWPEATSKRMGWCFGGWTQDLCEPDPEAVGEAPQEQFIRFDIHRAQLAQAHDLYAILARSGVSIDTIIQTAERAAKALREGAR